MRWEVPISARRLRNRTVRHRGRVVRGVTLFPLFNAEGRTQFVMAVTRGSPEVCLSPAADFPTLRQFGRVQIPGSLDLFRRVRKEDIGAVTGLWHFDPWWMLDDSRFATHWARKLLRETNCVNRTGAPLAAVYYRGDLSEAVWITHKGKDGLHKWKSVRLPTKAPDRQPASAPPKAHWILDPIWKRR